MDVQAAAEALEAAYALYQSKVTFGIGQHGERIAIPSQEWFDAFIHMREAFIRVDRAAESE
jgi:hypothetical protein